MNYQILKLLRACAYDKGTRFEAIWYYIWATIYGCEVGYLGSPERADCFALWLDFTFERDVVAPLSAAL